MHGIYDSLQSKGLTGPFHMVDGQMVARPFVEYPKWVTKADGSRVIVKDIREEAAMAGDLALARKADPLASEREALAAKGDELDAAKAELDTLKAEMRAQLDELATARAALQGQGTPVAQAPKTDATAGSSFRLPKSSAPSAEVPPSAEAKA